MNTCFVTVTTLSYMCDYESECLSMQFSGEGDDSIQDLVRPWPPDFGHFVSHVSFTQFQTLQAAFCHVDTEQTDYLTSPSSTCRVTCSGSDFFFFLLKYSITPPVCF